MKSTKLIGALALALGLSTAASAQVQVGVQGSYLKGTGDNDRSIWGGGVHAKFFLGDNIALGGIFRTYPKKSSEYTVGNYTVRNADLLNNVMGTLDFLVGKAGSPVRPFIGVDAGVSMSSNTTLITTNSTTTYNDKNKQTFFIAAPKVGLNFELGKAFGIFGQAQYNLTFGDGNSKNANIPGINNNSTKPVDKFFTFDAGVFFRLSAAK